MKNLFVCLSVTLAVLAVTSTQTLADDNVIYGCVDKKGHIRVVSDLSECKKKETPLFWNQTGPQGPPGPEGAQGEPGPSGQCDSNPPTLTINPLSEIHLLDTGYSITADVDAERGISHVIFNVQELVVWVPDKIFVLTEAPFIITPYYLPPNVGDSFKVNVIALDNCGNSAKDSIIITRVPSPPDLLPNGGGATNGIPQYVRVSNWGDTEARDFYVDLYLTGIPPVPEQIGDLRIFVDYIAGRVGSMNAYLDLDISNLSIDPSIGVYVQVDTDNQIAEFDETNNIRLEFRTE